jgi:hypothetical protein
MNTDQGSLVGIKGWLLLYVAYLYVGLLAATMNIVNSSRSLSDPLAAGSIRAELLTLLAVRIVVFVLVVIVAWMIHRRQPQTRKMILILQPIGLSLGLFEKYRRYTLAKAVAGLRMGRALTIITRLASVHFRFISMAIGLLLSIAWWLYWLRSERVKQTFAFPTT